MAFKNTGYLPVFGLRFSPYNKKHIITCGLEHMAVWKLKGTHLTCKHFSRYKTANHLLLDTMKQDTKAQPLVSILMCMDFISFKLGHSI